MTVLPFGGEGLREPGAGNTVFLRGDRDAPYICLPGMAERVENWRAGRKGSTPNPATVLRHAFTRSPSRKLEHLTGVFAKIILQLLIRFPSADALRKADIEAVAAHVVPRSWGKESKAWVESLMATASSSVGVSSLAKELVLKQDAALLLYVQEQIKETTKVLMGLCTDRMRKDVEILASTKGIGKTTALNFLIETGGDITLYKNDKKLIAASGLDPSTYQSGKYEGASRLSKRGNRHLRRVIWLMAKGVVFSNDLFRTYFDKRKSEGLCYKMAMLATAHKLIRVMFAMLVHQTCFEQGGR